MDTNIVFEKWPFSKDGLCFVVRFMADVNKQTKRIRKSTLFCDLRLSYIKIAKFNQNSNKMLQRIVSRFVVNSRPFLCQASHLSSETIVPNFDAQTKSENTPASFATLLRNSPFVQMGNPEGKVSAFYKKSIENL